MSRRKRIKNLTLEKNGTYRYRNPLTGERKRIGRDREYAERFAIGANHLVDLELARRRQEAGSAPTVAQVIDQYIDEIVPNKPWSQGTLANNLYKLRLYQQSFGQMLLLSCDRSYLTDWIHARCKTADCRNGHQRVLTDIWRFAISRNLAENNEPGAIYPANKSTKLEQNKKRRKRLSIEDFWLIHDLPTTPLFLRHAMRIGLITRLGRLEIVNLKYPVDGWFYSIRQKTASHNDLAFQKFPVTSALQEVVDQSRASAIACPFVVHYKPLSLRPQHQQNKAHWAAVTPEYLSKSFKRQRDFAGVGAALSAAERPSFHEVRSLGSRLLKDMGWSMDDIRSGLGHTDETTTQIYLSDPDRITSEHYNPIRVDWDITKTRGSEG